MTNRPTIEENGSQSMIMKDLDKSSQMSFKSGDQSYYDKHSSLKKSIKNKISHVKEPFDRV